MPDAIKNKKKEEKKAAMQRLSWDNALERCVQAALRHNTKKP